VAALGGQAEADDGEVRRQDAVHVEVVDGRQELAPGEVAGGAEDDQDAGLRDVPLARTGGQGQLLGAGLRRDRHEGSPGVEGPAQKGSQAGTLYCGGGGHSSKISGRSGGLDAGRGPGGFAPAPFPLQPRRLAGSLGVALAAGERPPRPSASGSPFTVEGATLQPPASGPAGHDQLMTDLASDDL